MRDATLGDSLRRAAVVHFVARVESHGQVRSVCWRGLARYGRGHCGNSGLEDERLLCDRTLKLRCWKRRDLRAAGLGHAAVVCDGDALSAVRGLRDGVRALRATGLSQTVDSAHRAVPMVDEVVGVVDVG